MAWVELTPQLLKTHLAVAEVQALATVQVVLHYWLNLSLMPMVVMPLSRVLPTLINEH